MSLIIIGSLIFNFQQSGQCQKFSACFGAPFLPLHPTKYAEMLGAKMDKHDVNVWLINTGWTGGPYGVGRRMKLKYTRAMITAAMDGSLEAANKDNYHTHSVFGVQQPRTCPNVPSEVLSPRSTWNNDEGYYETAAKLSNSFRENFKKFEDYANDEIIAATICGILFSILLYFYTT